MEHSADVAHSTGFFLRPVHFRRAVLERYFGDPDRYSVTDGVVHGPTFTLSVDNDHEEVVIVYLGDLGHLPSAEQQHWRAHNLAPDGPISRTAYQRDVLGEFAAAEHVDHRLKEAYSALVEAWQARFGWPLYLPPVAADAHVLAGVHVPTNTSMGAFEAEIVPLAKCTVDSLNDAKLTESNVDPPAGGINRLEQYLVAHGLPTRLPEVLRIVQGARTHAGAHRKSRAFDLGRLLQGDADPAARFSHILEDVVTAFDDLRESL